jgi:hypothetical protein
LFAVFCAPAALASAAQAQWHMKTSTQGRLEGDLAGWRRFLWPDGGNFSGEFSRSHYFYGTVSAEAASSRLVGLSVWNSQWKLVIPTYSLLNDKQGGLDNFIKSVSDIKLFLRTYSSSGN